LRASNKYQSAISIRNVHSPFSCYYWSELRERLEHVFLMSWFYLLPALDLSQFCLLKLICKLLIGSKFERVLTLPLPLHYQEAPILILKGKLAGASSASCLFTYARAQVGFKVIKPTDSGLVHSGPHILLVIYLQSWIILDQFRLLRLLQRTYFFPFQFVQGIK